jgi:branched chain amino acid efflux pump
MTAKARRPDCEWRAALVDITPAMVAGVPFAALCGALAIAKGLSPAEVFAMSLVVFAGGAQFAAIEIWRSPVPVFAVVVSTLLINARHVLMGASLGPKLHALRAPQRVLGCFTLADENWALAERRATVRAISPTYFLVMGVAFWANWVWWSFVGALLGPVLGDPKRLGADFAFTAIFIGLIVSLCTGPRSGGVVAASAVTAALVRALIGSPWHVLSGALAGIVAAAVLHIDEPGAR